MILIQWETPIYHMYRIFLTSFQYNMDSYNILKDSLKHWPAGLWPVKLWTGQLKWILSGPFGQCTFSGQSGQHFSTGIPLRSFVFIPLETYFLGFTTIVLCNQCRLPLKLWVWTPLMASCTRYNIMWCKFVNDLRQVGGFLQVLQFPLPIKLTAMI
jgi:hypothetical protein